MRPAEAGMRQASSSLNCAQALFEVAALHLVMGTCAGKDGRKWVLWAWSLAVTHLGLLEDRKSLGLANILTLARGNLPAVEKTLDRWMPVLALTSDFADGRIARATGTETLFGQHADFLADTAFWLWFSVGFETSRIAKVAACAAWAVPVATVASASFVRGRMIDVPRSWWFRPAAAVQILLGARLLKRRLRAQP